MSPGVATKGARNDGPMIACRIPTKLAALNMVVDIIVSVALYKPLGIAGLVIGTATANLVMTVLQLHRLRVGFNGRLEGAQTLMITVRILVATVIMAAVARGVWALVDAALGRSFVAELFAVGLATLVAGGLYAKMILGLRVPEARQIESLIRQRLGRG